MLGECLSWLEKSKDLPSALGAYQHLRKTRCERVQDLGRGNAGTMTLGDGHEQEARDRRFRATTEMYEKRRQMSEAESKEMSPRVISKTDMYAKGLSPESSMWLLGYDCIGEARPVTHIEHRHY